MADAQGARERLAQLASTLRSAEHLEPAAQRELADLLDELSKALANEGKASAESAHLAESAAHLAQTLQHQPHASLLGAARRRLEESAARAEAEAPMATGIVRRLLAALADLGI